MVFVNNAAYLVNTDVYFDGRKHYADGGTEPRLRFYGLAARHWQLNSGLRDLVLALWPGCYLSAIPAGGRGDDRDQSTGPPGSCRSHAGVQPGDARLGPWGPPLPSVSTPQTDLYGKLWVFNFWSDGGPATHTYVMPSQAVVVLTVKFVPGGRATFLTNPPSLALNIDGRSDWSSYNFVWAAGVPHTLSAPQQVDAAGHGWAFKSWSNGGAATQVVLPSNAEIATGFRLTANFTPTSQTTAQTVIQTSRAGLHLLVNGADCVTPCLSAPLELS